MDDQKKLSLGASIDAIMAALEPLDEPNRKVAINAVLQAMGIKISYNEIGVEPRRNNAESAASSLATEQSGSESRMIDIRSLKSSKDPQSTVEMAAIIAFYLQQHAPESDRKDVIGKDDLDKYFRQAEYPLPKRMEQVLLDAKGSGYFDTFSRGQYKLNPVGYNLVVHTLPRKASPARLSSTPRPKKVAKHTTSTNPVSGKK